MLPDQDTVTGPCRVTGCSEERVAWTFFCRPHLNDNWSGRLRRLANNQWIGTVGPQSREPFVPEWRKHLTAKDMTRSAA